MHLYISNSNSTHVHVTQCFIETACNIVDCIWYCAKAQAHCGVHFHCPYIRIWLSLLSVTSVLGMLGMKEVLSSVLISVSVHPDSCRMWHFQCYLSS